MTLTNVSNGHPLVANGSSAPGTRSYASATSVLDVPNLIQVQLDSFHWFKTKGLGELFSEISPIEDFPRGGRFELSFLEHRFDDPKHTEEECRIREITFSAPMYVTVQLKLKTPGPGQGEVKEQELFIGDVPMMTTTGTFVINGAERVVVSQLVRSPGVYFTTNTDPATGRPLTSAKLIPYRGAWMEFETSNRDVVSVKVDRKRKTPVTMLLRALGYSTDQEIHELFEDVDTNPEHQFMRTTIEKDTTVADQDEALLEFYRRLRPGEPPSPENARNLLDNLFFNPRRYDLGRVGRYKLNRRLFDGRKTEQRTLESDDIVALLRMMIRINNRETSPDDIDHLGNRRVRAVGELIQNQVRVGLLRMERVIKERMTTQLDPATTTPAALVNIRPVVAAVKEFFGGSQLSQFMDQTNPLAELTHKRRLSALGPRRPFEGARRVRRQGRTPLPLRSHLSDRNPGRSQHRPAWLARHVRPHQRVRVHRDAVPPRPHGDEQFQSGDRGARGRGTHRGRERQDDPSGQAARSRAGRLRRSTPCRIARSR